MKTAERLFLVAGCLLFAWLLWHIGLGTLAGDLSLVGWGFTLVVVLELFALVFNSLAWRLTLAPDRRVVPLPELFGMRLAGDSINYVTPSATIGGEFVKARLLSRRVPMSAALSSVGLGVLLQFASQILFVLAAVPFFTGALLERPGGRAVFAGIGVLLLALAAVGFLSWRGDLFRRIRALLHGFRWLPASWLPSEEKWSELDEHVFGTIRNRPGDAALAVVFFALGWAMGAIEVYWVLHCLRVPIGWQTAFSIEALSVLVDVSTFFVPAKMGTQEGGKYAIFLLLGLDATNGFTVGVVRRLREILWAAIGLLVFGMFQRSSAAPATVPGAATRDGQGVRTSADPRLDSPRTR